MNLIFSQAKCTKKKKTEIVLTSREIISDLHEKLNYCKFTKSWITVNFYTKNWIIYMKSWIIASFPESKTLTFTVNYKLLLSKSIRTYFKNSKIITNN